MNSGHGYSPPHDQLFMSIVPGHHGMLQPPPNMGAHPGLPGQPMPPPGGSMAANHLDVHAHLGPHPGGMPAQHTTLAQHGALLHPHDRIRLRACPVPGCDFVTNQGRARLEKHLATHGTEKPFKCGHEGCGKAFKTPEHLKQHARCHATERNFRCTRPLCEDHEAFKSLPELRLHESRMHTLDKAEGREMKLKEKVAKMEADAESARKDNATLRKAVELLQTTLKEATAPRRPRKRKGGGDREDEDEEADAGKEKRDAGNEKGDARRERENNEGNASTSRGDGSNRDGSIPVDDAERKRVRKTYTPSASNVLRAARAARAAALASAEERWDKGKGTSTGGGGGNGSRRDAVAAPSASTAAARGCGGAKSKGPPARKLPRGQAAPLMEVTAAGIGVGGDGDGGSTRNARNAAAAKE